MKQWNLTLVSLIVLLAGCGVDTANAPRKNLVPQVGLRSFPKQNWRFPNNKFFLWRDDMTPEHAKRALEISKDIDDLDGAALPLTRKAIEMDSVIDPLKDQQKLIAANSRSVKLVFDNANRKLTTVTKSISELEAKIKLEKEPEVLAKLKDDLANLKGQQTAIKDQVTALKPVKEKFEKDLAAVKETLGPKVEEREKLEADRLSIENAGRARVDEIMTVVDWYKDQPQSLVFQFEKDGSISASISGWNLGDDAGPRNFSTVAVAGAKPTIRNVTYTELGGVFNFDVDVYTDDTQSTLRETFSFRLARIKYDNTDGRIFFGGELTNTVYKNGKAVVRKGLAKVVDRNN